MAKDSVADWDPTAANNTDIGGINIAEGCAPSNINNGIREMMAQIRADVPVLDVANTFTASVTISSTDAGSGISPTLDIYRNSASPEDGDLLGAITFSGKDDAGNKDTYALIRSEIFDASSTTEDAALRFMVMLGGSETSHLLLTGGQAQLGSGATTAPSLAFISSPGTGIFRGGADVLAFATAGVYAGRFDPSQNFLVGQTSADTAGNSATAGTTLTADGLVAATRTDQIALSANRRGSDGSVVALRRQGNLVGTISVTGSATAYNTTSDERLKDFIGPYDAAEAIAVIKADPVRAFTWKATGEHAVGWGAQTSHSVSPELASPGHGEMGDEDFMPWGVDQGKRTPYLWAAVSWLLDERETLISRIEALEANANGN